MTWACARMTCASAPLLAAAWASVRRAGRSSALSVVYREKTKPALKDEVVVPFLSRLREELSSLDCNVLKPQFAKEGDCTPMVRFVAAALDRVVGVVEKADA